MIVQLLLFFGGLFTGALIVGLWMYFHRKKAREIAGEIYSQAQQEKAQEVEQMLERIKDSFGALSIEALRKSTDEFLKLAGETVSNQTRKNQEQLEHKKELIDETLKSMKQDLGKVESIMQKIENERKQSFGELASQLKLSAEQTRRLQETTNQLNTALSNSQVRGQWGERMAEDVLRLAGFVEGINYLKQASVQSVSSRPDFTFLLPHDLRVNMDVKFPLNNYLAYLQAENDTERENFKSQFLRDVRNRVKEVTSRDYINPAENTVDYVIVFIPNEQVYAFINENDKTLMDDALKSKVILSSPVTLYAILAIIRQAVDNFNLERTASEILSLLGEFNKQWDMFKDGMDKMGKKLDDAKNEFQKLISTRSNKLEKPLQKIDTIRQRDFSLPDGQKNLLK